MAKRSRKKERNNPAASLTDNLIVEILARLPVKSLCRFKCVSKHWRGLISHPDHRWRLPQTLAGVFYTSRDSTRFPKEARHFSNVLGIRYPPLICPSMSFFPGYERISQVLDSCNGLLLCRLRSERSSSSHARFRYLVCNPATESWVVLPDSGCGGKSRVTRLGFDPAVSLQFHVFEFIENEHYYVEGVQIYSCKTGAWSYRESEWDYQTSVFYDDDTSSVFLNGLLHLVVGQLRIVSVDVEGETWRMMTVPDYGVDDLWEPGFLGQYQGQLCYINGSDYENDLSIWVLKDYTTYDWILKHQVSIQRLCEKIMDPFGIRYYRVVTVHPACNMILYVTGRKRTLMAYHIDREETWVVKNLGSKCWWPYIPYTPFYSETLTTDSS